GAQSAILGGMNNSTEASATNSVVLGGENITATEPNTVYVPNINASGEVFFKGLGEEYDSSQVQVLRLGSGGSLSVVSIPSPPPLISDCRVNPTNGTLFTNPAWEYVNTDLIHALVPNCEMVKVGIGTKIPSEMLDVQGNIRINDNDLFLRPNSVNGNYGLGWYGDTKPFAGVEVNGPVLYGFSGGALGFINSDNGGEGIVLTWNPLGQVGIGITEPTEKLHIRGAEWPVFAMVENDAGWMKYGFNGVHGIIESSEAIHINWYSGNDVIIGGGGTAYNCPESGTLTAIYDTYLATHSGKVGIGTRTPSEKLDVEGNIRINNNDLLLRGEGWNGNHGLGWYGYIENVIDKKFAEVNVDGPVLYGYRGGALGSNHSGTKNIALRWTENGTVGIGTDEPIGKLDILTAATGDGKALVVRNGDNAGNLNFVVTNAGWVYAREFKVSLDPFAVPDYVFEKDYNLMPLSELKEYLTLHKHLPEVPSATEIGKDGLSLGEMNVVLLKKVEELTLYVLQLKQEIDSLKEVEK
ncbi:MAG: hypothetical protein KKD31_16735, partial [Bacteroidetes bacterium]|nr:hypothetical protein [Bacteroidota bacterium]